MERSGQRLLQAEGIAPTDLEASANVIYALSADLRLLYFNPAWFRFARDNGGEPALSTRFPVGTSILAALDASLCEFYLDAWQTVLQTGKVWEHVYECSSDRTFRLADGDTWDWVPEWVRKSPENATGGICRPCYTYYWSRPAPVRP